MNLISSRQILDLQKEGQTLKVMALLWAVTLRAEEAPVPGHTQVQAPQESL